MITIAVVLFLNSLATSLITLVGAGFLMSWRIRSMKRSSMRRMIDPEDNGKHPYTQADLLHFTAPPHEDEYSVSPRLRDEPRATETGS